MKVIADRNVFDFDKVIKLGYRTSIVGNGYPIEIRYQGDDSFCNNTELIRVPTAACAYQLVCILTENWALDTPLFNVDKWLDTYRSFQNN